MNRVGLIVTLMMLMSDLVTTSGAENPLAILTNYLRVKTITGCEGDLLDIRCHHSDNKISIQSVFYGSRKGSGSPCVRNNSDAPGETCHVPAALGVVQNHCQGKTHCSVPISSRVLESGVSQCSGYNRHLEVTYQCRPSRFRSRTTCRDDQDEISCPDPRQGLVILSASFVSVEDNYFYCPDIGSPPLPADNAGSVVGNVMGDCVKTSARDKIEHRCHGENNCALKASPRLLAAPACEYLNVFLKVIYACVEQKNLIPLPLSELNTEDDGKTGTNSETDKIFTTPIKSLEKTINSDVSRDDNKDELVIRPRKIEDSERDKKLKASEYQEILEVGRGREMTEEDKKMIYSSELKFLSDQDHKISNEFGDTTQKGREGDRILHNSSDDNFLSKIEDPELLTVLITSVSGVVSVLGLALIFSLFCRKRAETRSQSSCPAPVPTQVKHPPPGHLVNLDSVSLESQESPDISQTFEKPSSNHHLSPVSLSTFQNNTTEISMLLPPSSSASNASSSSSASASCGGSTQFLQDLRTLDEKYSLVSSTPSAGLMDKSRMMGRFQTFSESTLLESISEADSELGLRLPGGCPRPPLSSVGGSSATFSLDTERHERSFEHFSHQPGHSGQHPGVGGCGCDDSQCPDREDQNITFII